MARSRNIKPSIMDNEELAELAPLARLLFIFLWMLADREGRLEDRPKRIAAQALPYDRGADVDAMLNDLQQSGFIVRYEVDGLACIQVLNFAKHQAPHIRESASDLPCYERGTTKAVPKHNLGSAEALPRSPDSLIPDSLIEDVGAKAPAAAAAPPPKPKSRKTPMPEGFTVSERVKAWAERGGYQQLAEHLDAFKRKCAANAYSYADWDAALMEAIREDWAKLRGRSHSGAAPPASATTVAHNPDLERTAALLHEHEQRAATSTRPTPELLARMNKLKVNA